MKEEKFNIKNSKGLEITGVVLIPENPNNLAFTMHGLGGFKEQPHINDLVDSLLKFNHVVVNFDATNSIGESEGKFENATVQNHYEDLVDVINWTKTQNWYTEPFILAGHSLGGYAVARYAEEYPQEVKAVFPYAAFIAGELSHIQQEKVDGEKYRAWKETGWQETKSESKPGFIKRLPWSHMIERLDHDLRLNASKLTMPILFVVGENDASCTVDNQSVLYNLVPGKKEMHIIPGAPHTFKEEAHLTQAKNIFEKWLKQI